MKEQTRKILGNPTSGSNFATKQLRELAKSTSPLSHLHSAAGLRRQASVVNI